MRKVLSILLVLVVGLAVTAQAGTMDKLYSVTLVGNQFLLDGAPFATRTGVLTTPQCENIQFQNNTVVTIIATNIEAPWGHSRKADQTAGPGGTTAAMTFCAPDDDGVWVITVDDVANPSSLPAKLTLFVNVADVPATGTYGLVLLGLLLVGTAVFLLARRRATA